MSLPLYSWGYSPIHWTIWLVTLVRCANMDLPLSVAIQTPDPNFCPSRGGDTLYLTETMPPPPPLPVYEKLERRNSRNKRKIRLGSTARLGTSHG